MNNCCYTVGHFDHFVLVLVSIILVSLSSEWSFDFNLCKIFYKKKYFSSKKKKRKRFIKHTVHANRTVENVVTTGTR